MPEVHPLAAGAPKPDAGPGRIPGLCVPVAVIGGGPAGLMAAETIARAGVQVTVFEAKPSLGRKFLRAGIGGLNLTHGEDYAVFRTRFGDREALLHPALDAFGPNDVRRWAAGLGVETFVGSSGRVFPVGMKAAPLLRAWLQRLRSMGVEFRTRHRFCGWNDDGRLRFEAPGGELSVHSTAVVLALGGGSWPQLGSDAAWVPWLQARGVGIAPLRSANCGFDVTWSPHLRERYAGDHVKGVALTFTDADGRSETRRGEFVVTGYGVEGGLIYAFSRRLREAVEARGSATFHIDLLPARSREEVFAEVSRPRGARSLSSHLQSRLALKGVKAALLREVLGKEGHADLRRLADTIKAVPVTATAARPLAEAISTAGGVRFDALDDHYMIRALPGVFAVGEMLDWEAPTGGYLLTACLAQGAWAGAGVAEWLAAHAELVPLR